jgi:GDPmannose 4,6-dehydratase
MARGNADDVDALPAGELAGELERRHRRPAGDAVPALLERHRDAHIHSSGMSGEGTRRALITGIGGQDGSLLAELLLEQGYDVVGVARRAPHEYENLRAIRPRLELIQADLLDQLSLVDALETYRPTEVYNLASPSFVPLSWRQPVRTAEFAAVGVTALLEAIRHVDVGIRFYQASSSEIFGEPHETPQSETTPLSPLTPYGVAKAYGHFIIGSYRRRYGLHGSCGILYNHESPRRPADFLPSKVARGAAAIALGLEGELWLGDLNARRDWGYAADYVRAMWLMLQQDEPGDYVIATGETHSVRELVECAFARVGLDWRELVHIDESLKRGRAELHDLVGNPERAHERLGWETTVDFEGLVGLLVDAELERLRPQAAAGTRL